MTQDLTAVVERVRAALDSAPKPTGVPGEYTVTYSVLCQPADLRALLSAVTSVEAERDRCAKIAEAEARVMRRAGKKEVAMSADYISISIRKPFLGAPPLPEAK